MKKTFICFMAASMVLTTIPNQLKAAVPASQFEDVKAQPNASKSESSETIPTDDEKPSRDEKRTQRKKERAEKKDHGHNGIFISVGAVILIVLIIVILL